MQRGTTKHSEAPCPGKCRVTVQRRRRTVRHILQTSRSVRMRASHRCGVALCHAAHPLAEIALLQWSGMPQRCRDTIQHSTEIAVGSGASFSNPERHSQQCHASNRQGNVRVSCADLGCSVVHDTVAAGERVLIRADSPPSMINNTDGFANLEG